MSNISGIISLFTSVKEDESLEISKRCDNPEEADSTLAVFTKGNVTVNLLVCIERINDGIINESAMYGYINTGFQYLRAAHADLNREGIDEEVVINIPEHGTVYDN